jgi:hypothetical protein
MKKTDEREREGGRETEGGTGGGKGETDQRERDRIS